MRYRLAAFACVLGAPALIICAPVIAEPTPADQTAAQRKPATRLPAATARADEPAAPSPAVAPRRRPTPIPPPHPRRQRPTAPAPAAAAETPPQPELLGALVRKTARHASPKATDADREDATALKAYYEARKDEPLWIGGDALTAKAAAAIAEIKRPTIGASTPSRSSCLS